jgi:hypothetical protein
MRASAIIHNLTPWEIIGLGICVLAIVALWATAPDRNARRIAQWRRERLKAARGNKWR